MARTRKTRKSTTVRNAHATYKTGGTKTHVRAIKRGKRQRVTVARSGR